MKWTPDQILAELRKLHQQRKELSYLRLAKTRQSLVSAAVYHFGTYRDAVEKAGIDYLDVSRHPRWSREKIIRVIRQAHKAGRKLNWSSVTAKDDEMALAAFAAVQGHMFGNWANALRAAGFDPNKYRLYRTWDRKSIVAELRNRARKRRPLNSAGLQKEEPGLHAASMRCFGTLEKAMKAAGLDLARFRQRRRWKKEDAIRELRAFARRYGEASDGLLRKKSPPLYGASIRFFGSIAGAQKAARL